MNLTNAANEIEVKKAKEKEKSQRELELDDLRSILQLAQGRRLLWRYLLECRVFKINYTLGQENLHDTVFQEGKRNIGNKLLAEITEADPKAYLLMASEAEAKKGKKVKDV